MELRTTEKQVDELVQLYRKLQQHGRPWSFARQLPPLAVPENQQPDATTTTTTTTPVISFEPTETASPLTATETLALWDTLAKQVLPPSDDSISASDDTSAPFFVLSSRITKFTQRLSERDPITNQPRYGTQTAQRVTTLCQWYESLQSNVQTVVSQLNQKHEKGNNDDNDDDGSANNKHNNSNMNGNNLASVSLSPLDSLRHAVADEQAQHMAQQQAAQRHAEEQAQLALAAERQRQEAQHQQEQLEQARVEAERRQRHEAIVAQQRAQEDAERAARRAEQEWQRSIVKGIDGVKQYLQQLCHATPNDPEAQRTALQSLQRIFAQIVAHPEDVNVRRIRRTHEQFQHDIGRHEGGTELLIAAGFRVTNVDDVPCLVATEPDLEHDMDGWSEWYDVLKATLTMLQQHVGK